MKKTLLYIFCALSVTPWIAVNAQETQELKELAELKLIATLDEPRGWCLDIVFHATNAKPLGGYQSHTCFTYDGDPTEDTAFVVSGILEKSEFRNAYFDQCATLYEPTSGSFIASEPCDGSEAQKIELKENGQVVPVMAPDLCLTIGTRSVAGGGGSPLHIIRKASFDTCDDSIADRQRWTLRSEFDGLAEPTEPFPFANNPAARMPGPPPTR